MTFWRAPSASTAGPGSERSTASEGPCHSARTIAYALAIAAATCLAYANAFPETFGGLDAKESIRDNPYIRNVWPLRDAMSLPLLDDTIAADAGSKGGTLVRRPLLSLTFALNQALLGAEPWGYHLVNIAIHLSAALLLFALVRRTLGVAASALPADGVACAIALLWALHPLQTESVTNLVQRAESLMGFWYLLTLYGVLRATSAPKRAGRWTALAWAACALGMATKETMVTAPLVALLFHWVFTAHSSGDIRRHFRLHAALASTWIIIAVLVVTTADDVARDFEAGHTLPYFLAQPLVILHYLRLTFWPDALHVYVNTHAFAFTPGVTPASHFLLPAVLLAGALAAGVLASYRRQPAGFLVVAFFALLAPTSSLVATSDVIQEHRMYLSLACVIALVVGVAERITRGRRRWALIALLCVASALAARTHVRNADYHSEFDMVFPGDRRNALQIVARHEFHQGNIEQAVELFDEALALIPDSPLRAEAHYDLANLFLRSARHGEAHRHLQAAIDTDPTLAAAHNNLGVLLVLAGEKEPAERHFREALTFEGRHYPAMLNLGLLLATRGDYDEARTRIEEVLRLVPQASIVRNLLDAIEARSRDAALPDIEIDLTLHLLPGYSDAYLQMQPWPPESR